MPDAVPAVLGVYQPRRPRASPLFRLVQDHLRGLLTVYDERFAHEYGPWRPVMEEVADKSLACGILAHGFARIRCDDCAHEYLLAFSCKCRDFCPSCHAKRLALWTQWLDTTRYCGWYANPPCGRRRHVELAAAQTPLVIVTTPRLAPTEATRRWAALLRQIIEVDPLHCPTCQGVMRIVACITQRSLIEQILAHLGTRAAAAARSPPSTRGPAGWDTPRRCTGTPAS